MSLRSNFIDIDCFFFLVYHVQIDSDVIALMDDEALAEYIPCYGDRIAVFNFCKNKKQPSKRKTGLLDRLREKMKLRKETTTEESGPSTSKSAQQTKKQRARNVAIGWIHNDGEVSKQVREKQGGGTRKLKMSTDAGITEILEEGKKLFFPNGISPKGSELDFEFEVWDFKQNHLTHDTCLSIGNMYAAAKLLHCNKTKRR